MARYTTAAQAEADGFSFAHQPQQQRFALLRGGELLGEAHYRLSGDGETGAAINFDHTVVDPQLRGSGLAALLADRALTDEIVTNREIRASCWYMREHLERNPHLLGEEAAPD